MLIRESEWLKERLAAIPDGDLFPLLDVGSSTLAYRTEEQPWVQRNVFDPLERRGGRIWHTDFKSGPGIDLSGDLLDPAFVARLAQLEPRSATVLNVLHHVRDREALCRSLRGIVRPGGYVIVAGPHDYPRHFDPIDTMFRPDVAEVAALFPGARVEASAILDSGNWRQWNAQERYRSLPRYLARLCVPFYRPRKWLEVAYQAPYLVRHIRAVAVVLRLP